MEEQQSSMNLEEFSSPSTINPNPSTSTDSLSTPTRATSSRSKRIGRPKSHIYEFFELSTEEDGKYKCKV